ncbi:peptidyl-prolyl cis-trans isomerase [bacterium]|nr:MAG: peptidyl-prolyl cis-trans isomerase [bacterium]
MYSLSVSDSDIMKSRNATSMRQGAYLLVLLIVALAPPARSQRIREYSSYSSLLDPRLDRITVATVGPWTISAGEFMLSYEYGPAFVKRERDSRQHYLTFMAYEKLLALDGRDRGLGSWPDLQRQVKEIEADLATEELYKEDVLPHVKVGDGQIARGTEQERVHLTVRWIFTPTAPAIDAQVRMMKTGVSFDSLYAAQLRGEVKPDDRSLKTTKFKLRMQNPMFASIIDTMQPGAVSLPVHGPDGWYIVKMADAWKNPIVTQSEEVKMREDVKRSLSQHLADSLSDDYVQRMIVDQHPVIVRETFNAIQAYLGRKFLSKEKFDEWELAGRKGARELKDVSRLDTIESRALVQLKNKNLNLRTFLDWYRMREPYIKLSLTSQQGFFQSVEGIIWRMVRDRLLTDRAFERKLQNRTSVRRQKEWWKEKFLYLANKGRIADTIQDSLPLLRKYYEENARNFCDTAGVVKPFDEVREDVWREYSSFELTKKLLHEILRLKQNYGVAINEDALKKVVIDIENDPKAIDVYTIKKGGIYPRTAFPTIDYDWQSWN